MEQIAVMPVRDLESGDEAYALIRAGNGHIALGLSLRNDGDVEIVMTVDDGRRLLHFLQQALAAADSPNQ
jgi:hypothetical protein